MANKINLHKAFKFESETIKKMSIEMSKEQMRSENNMINFCIKYYYENVFKKT